MRYVLKQNLFSLGDDFHIRDDHGQDVYIVDGKVFSLGHKLAFRDLNGAELAYIEQKLLAWGPTFHIYRNGVLAATVKKKLFTLFRCRFSIDTPGPDDLEAEGNFTDHEYTFTRQGRIVATVSKKWFTLGDTYGVDVAEGEDDVLVLASAVVIDLCCHRPGEHAG